MIVRRYQDFQGALPALCDALAVKPSELRFRDYANIVKVWLTPPAP
ncbi:MAG: hypothetical protein P4M00_13190 [Azospirillaceae bacterium]|nr:hypothetical protein [Azospirillaceae bacterium]